MFFKLLISRHLVCLQVDKVGEDSSLGDWSQVQLQLGAGRLGLGLHRPHGVHSARSGGLDKSGCARLRASLCAIYQVHQPEQRVGQLTITSPVLMMMMGGTVMSATVKR